MYFSRLSRRTAHHHPLRVFALLGVVALATVLQSASVWADTLDSGRALEAARHARAWRQQHEHEIIEEFVDLLALPNFAGDSEGISANAAHILKLLEKHQIQARLLQYPGAVPAIYAEIPSPGAQHWLSLYVHYDGQPTQAADWQDPPFEPSMRAGRIEQGADLVAWREYSGSFDPEWRLYARSAGDDKAPIIALLAALEALRANGQPLGVNLKLFFEGEEEIGSPNLGALVAAHREVLAADFWLFLDGPLHQSGSPSLSFGVRGVTGADLTVYGPVRGLHSGHYGNYAANPIARLAHLLSSMRDEHGQILIPGFDHNLKPLSDVEQAMLAQSPDQEASLLLDLGLAAAENPGERYELSLLRPALNFKGIRAGEVGAQARNVIVPSATASLGFRLVPGQSLAAVREQLEQHVRDQGYHLIKAAPSLQERAQYGHLARLEWEQAGYPAVRTALDHPAAQALVSVLREYRQQSDLSTLLPQAVADQVVVSPSLGGSLPLAHITETLQVPFALLPIANHDDNQHAANEHLRLGNLWYGIEIYAALLGGLMW